MGQAVGMGGVMGTENEYLHTKCQVVKGNMLVFTGGLR